jgi:hypothetical protein
MNGGVGSQGDAQLSGEGMRCGSNSDEGVGDIGIGSFTLFEYLSGDSDLLRQRSQSNRSDTLGKE